jgi:KDO2-lipid IV(A) lauroyltransferase
VAERPAGPSSIADRAGHILYRLFALLLSGLPRRAVLTFGEGLGLLGFWLDGRHRRIALDNLDQAFGRERSAVERRTIARRSFRTFGRNILETVRVSGWSQARVLGLIEVEGRERLERAHAAGLGVLLFSAHFGNWEMIVPPVSTVAPYHIIARALDNPLIDRDVVAARTRHGAAIINKLGAGRPVLRALGRGDVVGILIDQNVLRREAVFVDFFGRPAATTPALAVLHLRTGAPIVPMIVDLLPAGRYRVRFGPPVEIAPTGDEHRDVLIITGICTKMIEAEIRRLPEAWLWVHKRWQSRPPDERQDRQERTFL